MLLSLVPRSSLHKAPHFLCSTSSLGVWGVGEGNGGPEPLPTPLSGLGDVSDSSAPPSSRSLGGRHLGGTPHHMAPQPPALLSEYSRGYIPVREPVSWVGHELTAPGPHVSPLNTEAPALSPRHVWAAIVGAQGLFVEGMGTVSAPMPWGSRAPTRWQPGPGDMHLQQGHLAVSLRGPCAPLPTPQAACPAMAMPLSRYGALSSCWHARRSKPRSGDGQLSRWREERRVRS